LENSSRATIV